MIQIASPTPPVEGSHLVLYGVSWETLLPYLFKMRLSQPTILPNLYIWGFVCVEAVSTVRYLGKMSGI